MRKGRRDKLKKAEEFDALHRWSKNALKYLQKAGKKKAIRKRVNKRARQENKSITQEESAFYHGANE